MPISDLHQAALNYLAAGFKVFPCVPDAKAPATTNGFHDASDDPAQINAWWTENPDYNVATCPEDEGLCVVDIDPGAGEATTKELPDTYVVRTPRGGWHYFYEGTLPSSASKLADHVDTRGVGGYVLLAPSKVNGASYEVSRKAPFTAVPSWIATRLAESNHALVAATGELDLADNDRRARNYLADLVRRNDVAIAGRGGNDRTYKVASMLSDLGLSPERIQQLIEEVWNPACQPPWESNDLAVIIGNAHAYKQNEAGSYAARSTAEAFGSVIEQVQAEQLKAGRNSRFYFEDETEQENTPPPSWLIPGMIPEASTILVVGQTGSFKSFLVQEMLLGIASGKPVFGVQPDRVGPTFYGAHETRTAIKLDRRKAWRALHEIPEDFKIPFFVARAPHVAFEEECQQFMDAIDARLTGTTTKIGAIALDTVAKCMLGLDENDAKDMGRFVAFCDALKERYDCPIIVVHHLGKDAGKMGRGSTALQAGMDTTILIEREPGTKLVSAKVIQHALFEEPEHPWCLEGQKWGNAISFVPTDRRDFQERTRGDSPEQIYSEEVVEAVLVKAKCIDQGHKLSTEVLAKHFHPRADGEDEISYDFRVSKSRQALNRLLRKGLLGKFAHKDAAGAVWWWAAV